MGKIQVLDQVTIDKVAAGEVVERPASVVKELVENAIDAKATAVEVEIEEGGISLIRIGDNGTGMDPEDVRNAFLRHSTSKIRNVDDLTHISSLGFRGEALSSIAAVSQIEMITKGRDQLLGVRYQISGGKEISMEETGAKDGTTFLVRQLFYNVPARRKFLKTPMTEASHVSDLMTRLALSHPDISFQFTNNGQERMHTSGNGRLKDVIYHVYGREITANLIEVSEENDEIRLTGFIGNPAVTRGNRNFETFFVNGRYIKSSILSKAVEDAYKDFTMQHKYPFVVLHMEILGEEIDVNVHPTKMELRFGHQQEVYRFLYEVVSKALHGRDLIPRVEAPEAPAAPIPEKQEEKQEKRSASVPEPAKRDLNYFMERMKERVTSYHNQYASAEVKDRGEIHRPAIDAGKIREAVSYRTRAEEANEDLKHVDMPKSEEPKPQETISAPTAGTSTKMEAEQLTLFDEKLLDEASVPDYQIIGQVFDTYWIVQLHDSMYIIDQHAAHERVLYEQTLKGMKTRTYTSQYISPPIILDLSMQEAELFRRYMDEFTKIGFEIEPFGGDSFAVRAVPDNLFSVAKKELLMEMIDSLSDEISPNMTPEILDEKIASMSCKAAVKGNSRLSRREVEELLKELLTLDNPYHCPHGRPTIIAMTKRELEKKFKRIV
nr:DNA mismatch repair endonuclease MutL [uncultured Sellimonas sp.]